MAISVLVQSSLFALSAGILSHLCIFIRGEWHMQAPNIVRAYGFLCTSTLVVGAYKEEGHRAKGVLKASWYVALYLFGLLASICVYRVYFHRLRGFHGPFLAGVSKLWHAYHCLPAKNHLLLDRLYTDYGPIIRTGPNELTIVDPGASHLMNGAGNKCTKAVWYDFLLPEIAINSTRDKLAHDQRRRIWDQAFTPKALEVYSKKVIEYAHLVEHHVAAASAQNKPVKVSEWFYWFSFDVMGTFAFAKSFRMLEEKRWHSVVVQLRGAMTVLGTLSSIPWLARIGFTFFPRTWVIGDWHTMTRWCKDRMTERINAGNSIPVEQVVVLTPDNQSQDEKSDIASWLIDASQKNNSIEVDRHWLNGDAIAIVIAGSDTVAPTLVFIFYELARHWECAEKLFREISDVDIDNLPQLESLMYLNGFINEVLRLHPPVPTGGYRETPSEGLVIAGHYVPGNVTIVTPRYTLERLESCYEQADQFVPERWYSKTSMVKDRRAFRPFAQGRYGCVGKKLAVLELRYLTALLVSKYEIRFIPGTDGHEVEEDMMDQFTAVPGQLELCFRRRAVKE